MLKYIKELFSNQIRLNVIFNSKSDRYESIYKGRIIVYDETYNRFFNIVTTEDRKNVETMLNLGLYDAQIVAYKKDLDYLIESANRPRGKMPF